jgi:hypothetical protein
VVVVVVVVVSRRELHLDLIHFLRITVLKPKIATRFLHQSFRQNVL